MRQEGAEASAGFERGDRSRVLYSVAPLTGLGPRSDVLPV